jgi:fructosamine-3-kinase
MWESICARLSEQLCNTVVYQGNSAVSGGCIHNTQVLETNLGRFFVKIYRPDSLPMFEAEAAGLRAIKESNAIRCPDVLLFDVISKQAVLVLEFIPMQSAGPSSMTELGRQLADLHEVTQARFGWQFDNNIGLTPQLNPEEDDWIHFFRKYRLEFQMKLCEGKGLKLQGKEQLLENLDTFFTDYAPSPSLLHGDLWGGNVGFDGSEHPVLFDPGCYFGDREADLAFTEMFGGFSSEFYQAYNETWPLHEGYVYRKRLYNLYHELNHFYLFGGGYGSQAKETVRFLLNQT